MINMFPCYLASKIGPIDMFLRCCIPFKTIITSNDSNTRNHAITDSRSSLFNICDQSIIYILNLSIRIKNIFYSINKFNYAIFFKI